MLLWCCSEHRPVLDMRSFRRTRIQIERMRNILLTPPSSSLMLKESRVRDGLGLWMSKVKSHERATKEHIKWYARPHTLVSPSPPIQSTSPLLLSLIHHRCLTRRLTYRNDESTHQDFATETVHGEEIVLYPRGKVEVNIFMCICVCVRVCMRSFYVAGSMSV